MRSGRGYHRSCLNLARVPEEEWQCQFCAAPPAAVGSKRRLSKPPVWYKRASAPGAAFERMSGDDACHAPAQLGNRPARQRSKPDGAAVKGGKGAEAKGPAAKGAKVKPPKVKAGCKAAAKTGKEGRAAGAAGAEGPEAAKQAEAPVAPPPAATAPGASAAAEVAVAVAAAAKAAKAVQAALPTENFITKVARVKAELGIAEAKSVREALRQANEWMGLPDEGTLPAQVDALLRRIYS